jgi:UDP-N-acetylmuramate--alanine ligase
MTQDLGAYRRVHLIGAGGTGMAPLAKVMQGLGHEVSGSDLKPGRRLYSLGDLGIDVWVGHRPERAAAVDLVVTSSAVPASDPEVVAAGAAGVPVWPRPQLLDAITALMPAIGFTGTHGKTTSTALAVTALRAVGMDPSFIVGSEMLDLNTGAHLGDRDLFVLEADEAFGTFRHLNLRGLLVTNIEADHLDYYGNVAALEEAFALVANRTSGPVVGCVDDPGVRRLAGRAPVITYGVEQDATWRLSDLADRPGGIAFRLDGPFGGMAVDVPRPGMHIARNAAGVIALLAELGFDPTQVAHGMGSCGGVRRRFEVLARVAGITIVDDYAHHPTEIGATIGAGTRTGARRVIAVFQPHRYTRTAELAPEFGEPLARADEVIVTDVFPAGETPVPGVSGRLVAEAVVAAGGVVDYIPALDAVVPALASRLGEGDLVLLLGAGDINTITPELVATLEEAQ